MDTFDNFIKRLEKEDELYLKVFFLVGILSPFISIILLLGYYFVYEVMTEKQKESLNKMCSLWSYFFILNTILYSVLSFETSRTLMADDFSIKSFGVINSLSLTISALFYTKLIIGLFSLTLILKTSHFLYPLQIHSVLIL